MVKLNRTICRIKTKMKVKRKRILDIKAICLENVDIVQLPKNRSDNGKNIQNNLYLVIILPWQYHYCYLETAMWNKVCNYKIFKNSIIPLKIRESLKTREFSVGRKKIQI